MLNVTPGVDLRAERLRVERELRERLETARQEYDAAKIRVRRIAGWQREAASGRPDGPPSLRHALVAETEALIKYKRALEEFTNFLLNGNVPPSVRKPIAAG